ncbi:MAG: hypothetical protein JNK14_03055 [Chitinophagaceae bacterium]|nr:hypothetical protein [Chitinophagaceae bacterium]
MLSKTIAGPGPEQTRAFRYFVKLFVVLPLLSIVFYGFDGRRFPAPGVVAELRFNEGSGTTTTDVSGNAHNGTLVNGPVWSAGKYGQGINLDGTNDYVNIADHANFTLTPSVSYTWSTWVRNNNFNQWGTLFSQTLSTTNFFYSYAHTTNDAEAGPVTNGISVYWYSGSNRLVVHSNNNVLTTGTWSYVTVTYNASLAQASRFTIYVNGVDVTNRTDVVSSGTIATIDPNNIRIGSNQPYGEYLNGSVDEFRYYRRLLSEAEIQSDMNIGSVADTESPTVSISSPAPGNVSGTINVNASANDNTGVAGVQFQLDGVNLGAEDAVAPYSITWNTATATNGVHSLTAVARDAAGNITTSAAVSVTVNNDTQVPSVSITEPSGGTVQGTINVSAGATDNTGVAGVQFLLDGVNLGAEDVTAPYTISWNTATITDGSHTLTARARDAAGNTATSTPVVVTVQNNTQDTESPSVAITSPTGGTVSGTINVNASAGDNVGVAGVQFLLDGVNMGAEDMTAPYAISWITTGIANGSHILTARARDAAGNTTTSAAVNVTVNNTNLVAAYGFNENTGTTANDNSGNNNTGTLTNGAAWAASGRFGSAILFDGTNDYININDANSLDLTNGMTLEAWVNPSNLTGFKTVICKDRSTGNFTYTMAANNNASNANNQRPSSRMRIGSGNIVVTGTSKLTLNTWIHVASTYDGGTFRLYINGVQVSSAAVTGNITVTANPLRIGGTTALAGQYFAGLIDEVRIYNRALSQAEIQTDMNTPIAPDIIPPSVSITSPGAGTISGTVNITANASDNTTVAGVQFLLNGASIGTEDNTSPYAVSWNTTTIANGTYTLTARARDAAGNTTTSSEVIVTVNNDTESPVISITSPSAGIIDGTVEIIATASDNTGVAGVQFLLNGVNLGAEDVSAPYTFSWNTTTVTDGNYTLTARARDAAGNTTVSAPVVVDVLNNPPDTEAPAVNISSPAAGNVLGTVTITANASDNVGVIGVRFLLNGVDLGAEDILAPYSFSWNTLALANGSYTLTARARDAAGNSALSETVIVNVNNPSDTELPVISLSAPTAGNVSGIVAISATATDNLGVTGVQFLLDGMELGTEDVTAPYSFSWNTSGVSNGNHILSARARDAAGNTGVAADVIVTVNNDIEFPAISITAPAAGNVTGTITVSGNASDNTGVAGVQFLLDGLNLGAEDLAAPYGISWNTITVSNGSHTLTARARDAAGNTTTSAEVIVTVNNDITPPSVNITAPAAGSVSGTINVSANASDNVGVNGVQFLLNGANLGAEDNTAPYTVSWNTLMETSGNYTLTARARDAAGNLTTSAPVAVTVNNVTNLIAALGLNESSGTTAIDISGNNHNGTLTNTPARAAGKYGQGVNLNGSNQYINIADHNNFTLDPSQNYTWSTWVRNNNFTEWGTVWSQTLNTSNFFYFYAHSSSDADGGPVTNGVSVYWWVNGGASKIGAHSSNNVLTAGVWSHVAITYNAGQPQNNRFSIYVNGVDVTVRTDVSSAGTITTINPANIRIGSNQPFGEYLNGSVDEVRFYNKLLSATEVVADMNTPIGVDNTPPSIGISSPLGGNVSGMVNITATAADNFGVAGVQFLLDGANLEAEDVTAPYSLTWNTETVSNGPHVLTARARDAAGNTTTSSEVAINVAPDFTFTLLTTVKNVEVSGTTDFRINVTYLNGFATSSGVDLWFSGLPPEVTGHYLFDPMSHQGETQLFINTNNAPLGTYVFTVGATAEGITHTQQATLNITTAADFAITASPSILNVPIGDAITVTVNVNETNEFVSPVTLSVLGLPAGVTASFSPASPVPVAVSILTLTTSASTPVGTYNLTVQGVSGSTIRTAPVTLIVSSTPAVWTVSTIGSTGVPNNTVRVGRLKSDGLDRIYIGTIATGRMLEYTWNGTVWTGPLDIGGSPSAQEIHNTTIGPGRGDGIERLYAASYDNNIYEIWHNGTSWQQMTVGSVGNLGMHAVVGVGRNDGVTRLYASSTQELYEFTWNGTSWTKLLVGSTPGAHELALGNGRMDGKNYIYISSISSGNFEARWTGTAWTIASMGDNGDARGLELGDGRNDGITRVYSALYDGRVREFTWNGSAWTFINMPLAGTQNIHAYIVPGRNDGVNRIYTCNANGKVFEYTWNGTTWDIYNMGGGSDYMYGLHYGTGRNDGVIRFYGADRGSVNRVYEFTWTAPSPIVFMRKENETSYSAMRRETKSD